jgi:hypothetical protein
VLVRVALAPNPSLHGDFSWDNTRFAILLTIEMHFCIFGAAYVNLIRFAGNASTGFAGQMVALGTSKYGSGSNSKQRSRIRDGTTNEVTVSRRDPNETGSMETFGSQAIMVQTITTVEERDSDGPLSSPRHVDRFP